MEHPLAIRLEAAKPTFLVGEEPVLTLSVRVARDLSMETVPLNRHRTVIRLEPLDGGETVHWTGQDHIRHQGVHPLGPVGSEFRAQAGAEWSEPLHLFQYGPPPPAGRYQVTIAYRYDEESAVTSNTAAFTVAPALHRSNAYRWMGGANAYAQLANLWTAECDGRMHWIYQIAGKRRPGAIASAVDLSLPLQAEPVLAHINDVADFHFERWVLWAESGSLGAVKVHAEGRSQEPLRELHGLREGARIAEPPLQHAHGTCSTVLFGRNPTGAACLVVLSEIGSGAARRVEIPLGEAVPEHAVVAWPESGSVEAAICYWTAAGQAGIQVTPLRLPARVVRIETQGRIRGLAIEQWLGQGRAVALETDGEALHAVSVPILSAPTVTRGAAGREPVDSFAFAPGQPTVYTLRRSAERWRLSTNGEDRTIPVEAELEHPHLIVSPSGTPWLAGFDRRTGFQFQPFTDAEPEPLV